MVRDRAMFVLQTIYDTRFFRYTNSLKKASAVYGGYTLLVRLRRKVLTYVTFCLFQSKDNTYPVRLSFALCGGVFLTTFERRQGCGSDVPGHWYSLSRALNPHWTSYYPAQGELQAYWTALWERAGLRAHTRCGTTVVRATWDDTTRTYSVELEDAVSLERRTVVARVIINATGGFQAPRVPDDLRSATEVFGGACWHSARWQHDVPLRGKPV